MQTISPVDLRRWERQTVAIPVSIAVKANEVTLDSTTATMNVSLSGMGILTRVTLVPGQEVGVVIRGNFSRTIPARVVWVRKDESSHRAIAGLKFLSFPIALAE